MCETESVKYERRDSVLSFQGLLPMLRFVFAFTACLMAAVMPAITTAADFPPVSELKPRPGLPDPLVMLSGQKVQSKEQWEQERRPELKALFQHYMYGYLPPKPDGGEVRGATLG